MAVAFGMQIIMRDSGLEASSDSIHPYFFVPYFFVRVINPQAQGLRASSRNWGHQKLRIESCFVSHFFFFFSNYSCDTRKHARIPF